MGNLLHLLRVVDPIERFHYSVDFFGGSTFSFGIMNHT